MEAAWLLIAQSVAFSDRRDCRFQLRCGGHGSKGVPAVNGVLDQPLREKIDRAYEIKLLMQYYQSLCCYHIDIQQSIGRNSHGFYSIAECRDFSLQQSILAC